MGALSSFPFENTRKLLDQMQQPQEPHIVHVDSHRDLPDVKANFLVKDLVVNPADNKTVEKQSDVNNLNDEITQTDTTSSQTIYVITSGTVVAYAHSLEEAKIYTRSMISNKLIGHHLNHITVDINESSDQIAGAYVISASEHSSSILFSHHSIVCQYIIWKVAHVTNI
jgi:hypothetical protein